MKHVEIWIICQVGCGHTERVSRASFKMRRAAGSYPCPKCSQPMVEMKNPKGKTDSQKRSEDQEKRAAKRYEMKRQPGSGSKGHAKSDLVSKMFRGEMKETIRQSFSVKLDTLSKVEKECESGQHPFLEVEFQGVHPHKRYVVLPDWVFQWLKELAEKEG